MRKLERANVDFPMWRKKIDHTFFTYKGTTIPQWLWPLWKLDDRFRGAVTKKNPSAETAILFQGKTYRGFVTVTKPESRGKKVYRLWYEDDLNYEIKRTFFMSYIRCLDDRLRKGNKKSETENPFWEFLDIEYDAARNLFLFTAHYTQKASYPMLFSKLLTSPALKKIDDEAMGKKHVVAYGQEWKPRAEYQNEIGAFNVVYTLVDSKNKRIYVGEAKDLVTRFSQGHPIIKDWDYYRYDVLPKPLEPYRKTIERMMIRSYAMLFQNKKGIPTRGLSDYVLVNAKIDKG